MNKKFIAAVLLLAACFMVFANGAQESSEKITLTVWESLNGPDKFIEAAGKAFTAKYPNIEIKFVNVESSDAAGAIALDGPAGVGPDLFASAHDNIGKLVDGGLILPVANPGAIKGSLLGACIQGATYNGTMYGYPVSAETYAIYYNKDLISEKDLPKTWDDLAKWSSDFAKKNPGKQGFLMEVGNAYYTIIFGSAKGNKLFGESGTDFSTSYMANDAAISGMKVFQNLSKAINIPSADLNTNTVDSSFQAGTAAMVISGPWNIQNYKNAGINYGVAPLPAFPGEKTPSQTFSGVRCMFVSAFSEHPEEAALFAEFLVSDEMQELRYELTAALPSINMKLDDPIALGFLKQLDYAYPMRTGDQMNNFWNVFGPATSNIWDGADIVTELNAADKSIITVVK